MTPQQLVCDGKVMSAGSVPVLHAGFQGGTSRPLLRYDRYSFTAEPPDPSRHSVQIVRVLQTVKDLRH